MLACCNFSPRPPETQKHPMDAQPPALDPRHAYTDRGLQLWDRLRWPIFLGLIGFYLIGLNGQWKVGPDSAEVLISAKYWVETGSMHPIAIERGYAPAMLWLTAGSYQVFGLPTDGLVTDASSLWLLHGLIMALALLNLRLCYSLFSLHFDRRQAVLLTAMVGVTENVFRYSYQLVPETPFLTGALITLWGWERWRLNVSKTWLAWILIATGTGVMAATRSVALVFFAAMLLAGLITGVRMAIQSGGWKRGLWVTLGLVGAALAGRTLLMGGKIFAVHPDEAILWGKLTEPDVWHKAFGEHLWELLTESLPEATLGIDLGSWAGLPIGILLLTSGLLIAIRRLLWGVVVLAFVAQWLLFIVLTRYVMVLTPILAIAWWQMLRWCESWMPKKLAVICVSAGLMGWFLPNLSKDCMVLYEQFRPNFDRTSANEDYGAEAQISQWAIEHLPADVVLICADRRAQIVEALSGRLTPIPDLKKHFENALDGSRPLYAIEPLDKDWNRWLRKQDLTVGEVIYEATDTEGRTLTLYKIE